MSAGRLQRVACKFIGCCENARCQTYFGSPVGKCESWASQSCPTLGWIHLTDEVHNEPKWNKIPVLLRWWDAQHDSPLPTHKQEQVYYCMYTVRDRSRELMSTHRVLCHVSIWVQPVGTQLAWGMEHKTFLRPLTSSSNVTKWSQTSIVNPEKATNFQSSVQSNNPSCTTYVCVKAKQC